jgi:hypothetical protein
MINEIIEQEKELLATLKIIKDLTEEHDIFPLKGMIEQIDRLINRSELAVAGLNKWNIINNLGETDGKTDESTT